MFPQVPERILVRAPTWIGDAVMATPALRALRAAWPGAEIALEGRPAVGALLRGLASFDRFLPDPGGGPRPMLARARAIRRGRFDWAVLLPDSPRAALGPFLARVPRRVGYARDPLRRSLVNDSLAPPRERGRLAAVAMTERYLRITRHLGCADRGDRLELAVGPAAEEQLARQLAAHGVADDERLLVVTPGAAFGPAKRWPPGHFAAAAELLARGLGLLPVLAPAAGEAGLARAIAAALRVRAVALVDPAPELERLKALVARAALVLTNDSGPRQIAVALGRPAVVVMGPSDPGHSAQHLERQRVLREPAPCSPCGLRRCPIDHRCMTRLRPERVLAAAEELLSLHHAP
jgi:lipopolysaccharide heptosyltransferase II